jgi:hypothetical protein
MGNADQKGETTMVRGKFYVSALDVDGKTVTLNPVIDGSEENKQFFEATPSGEIRMGVMNQAALDEFEAGAEYYVDFTKAEAVPADATPPASEPTEEPKQPESTDQPAPSTDN